MLRQSSCEDRAPGDLRDCPRQDCCTPSWMGWLSEAGSLLPGWEGLCETGGKILALTFPCHGTIIICVLNLWCKCHYVVYECSWIIPNLKILFWYMQRIFKCINTLKTSDISPNLYICKYIYAYLNRDTMQTSFRSDLKNNNIR